jgi:3-oxoacyl-[acyl-carrier protein] reductase
VDLGFAEATAVISGGTRGIGLATALCLAEQGAPIGVIGRNDARLAETATTLAAAGSPEVLTLTGRLGLPQEVAAVIAFCASRANTYMTGAHLNVDGGSDFL